MEIRKLHFLLIFMLLNLKYSICEEQKTEGLKRRPISLERSAQESLRISRNVTKILDRLLQGYDKRLRPNYAGPPVIVKITSKIKD
jgi:hypothetical protein